MEGKIILYSEENTSIYVNVYFDNDTFWMTQKALAELFDCSTDNISLHLKNIYADEELEEKATTEEVSLVQSEGTRQVKRKAKYYSLDAIIAVGYRVNSKKGTRFRQWANKEYDAFRIRQDAEYISEFDRDMEKYYSGKKDTSELL